MSLTNEPGWQPDPFGRHEYRWWDGTTWSDQVSDGGVTATDPPGAGPAGGSGSETVALGNIPPAQPPGTPIGGSPPPASPGAPLGAPIGGTPPGAPPGAVPGAPPGSPPAGGGGGGGGGGATAAIVIAVIVVIALIVGAVLFFVLGGDSGGGGTGEFSATLEDDQLDFYEVDLNTCQGLRAELDNVDGFDAILGIAGGELDEDFFDDDDELDFYEDELQGFFDEGDQEDLLEDEELVGAWDTADSGFEDEDENVAMVAPYDLTVTVVVGSFDGEGGDYELTIETEDPPDDVDCGEIEDSGDFEDLLSDEADFFSDFFS